MRIHAAEEDEVRLGGLDLRQDRLEVGRLVVGVLGCNDLDAGRFGRLAELVGDTLAIGGTVIDDGNALGALLGGELAEALACWTSLAITRKAVLKPCCVYFGLVAEPEICGMPASEYSLEAGIVVPEFRWPMTPLTLASTSF